ncbi:MAG: S8 family serine peptidase [Candidatus Levybacteria bacterium]|nr:S8 family serine peptidase [Candidatus Levybacteria bacterium]
MPWQKLTGTKRARLLSLLSLVILLIVVPLTVLMSQQEQELRQQAASRRSDPSTREPRKKGYVEGIVLVKYRMGVNATVAKASVEKRLKKKKGRKIKRRLEYIPIEEIEVPVGDEVNTIAELKQDPNIEYAVRDAYVQAVATPDDPNFDKQYALRTIKAQSAWNETQGKNVVVAVLDTGIDENHPDLKGKIAGRKNFAYPEKPPDDLSGHGTHVAGIIAAKTDNNEGVAGACPQCKLLNVKVLKNNEQGTMSVVADGIAWAAQQEGVKVINLSVSGNKPDVNGDEQGGDFLEDAINEAWNKGIVVVVAAGNDGTSQKTYPAAYDNAIAVAATTRDDKIASFSNFGKDWVDVAAPGDDIYSTIPPHVSRNEGTAKYRFMKGTSMAAPLVSATAALVIAKDSNLTPSQVRSKLEQTAETVGNKVKFGRINAAKAVGASTADISPTGNILPPCDDTTDENGNQNNNQDNKGNKNNNNNNKNDKKDSKKDDKKENKKKDNKKKSDKKKGRNSKKNAAKKDGKTTPTRTSSQAVANEDCLNEQEQEEALEGDGTILVATVGLHGIGRGGDNANPNITGTTDPVTPERDLIVEIFDANNEAVASTIGPITFDKATGLFTGEIGIDGPPSGIYTILLRSPTYLRRRIDYAFPLKEKEINELPKVSLTAGDVNDDNAVNILDFNILTECIGMNSPEEPEENEEEIIAICTEQDQIDSDLDDNGEVNALDLNLYLRELLTRPGR